MFTLSAVWKLNEAKNSSNQLMEMLYFWMHYKINDTEVCKGFELGWGRDKGFRTNGVRSGAISGKGKGNRHSPHFSRSELLNLGAVKNSSTLGDVRVHF